MYLFPLISGVGKGPRRTECTSLPTLDLVWVKVASWSLSSCRYYTGAWNNGGVVVLQISLRMPEKEDVHIVHAIPFL